MPRLPAPRRLPRIPKRPGRSRKRPKRIDRPPTRPRRHRSRNDNYRWDRRRSGRRIEIEENSPAAEFGSGIILYVFQDGRSGGSRLTIQQLVERAHIGVGAGDTDVRIGAAARIDVIAMPDTDGHLRERVDSFGDGLYGELDQIVL